MSEANLTDYYEVRLVEGKGRGVFARRTFFEGEVIVIGRLVRRVDKRTEHSFQIDSETHIDLDEPAKLMNHSCEPNCGIKRNVFGGYDFLAIRDVLSGEELCWDYSMSEYESIAVKRCLCESGRCRGAVRGWKFLPEATKRNYEGFVAPYLLKK